MALPTVDWVQAIKAAAQSPLGIVALGLVVVLFVVLAVGKLAQGHKLVVILAIVALVAFFGYLVVPPPIDPHPVPVLASGCLIKDQAITVKVPVRLNAAGLTLTLISTTQENNGPNPRGALLKVNTETEPQFVEAKDGATPVYIAGIAYDVRVNSLRQDSAVVSVCSR